MLGFLAFLFRFILIVSCIFAARSSQANLEIRSDTYVSQLVKKLEFYQSVIQATSKKTAKLPNSIDHARKEFESFCQDIQGATSEILYLTEQLSTIHALSNIAMNNLDEDNPAKTYFWNLFFHLQFEFQVFHGTIQSLSGFCDNSLASNIGLPPWSIENVSFGNKTQLRVALHKLSLDIERMLLFLEENKHYRTVNLPLTDITALTGMSLDVAHEFLSPFVSYTRIEAN